MLAKPHIRPHSPKRARRRWRASSARRWGPARCSRCCSVCIVCMPGRGSRVPCMPACMLACLLASARRSVRSPNPKGPGSTPTLTRSPHPPRPDRPDGRHRHHERRALHPPGGGCVAPGSQEHDRAQPRPGRWVGACDTTPARARMGGNGWPDAVRGAGRRVCQTTLTDRRSGFPLSDTRPPTFFFSHRPTAK